MQRLEPAFLLGHPDLVTQHAPWCVTLENLDLGVLLLAQPWVAVGGLRRAELERRLGALARDLPLGPVYFQRVKRAVAKLEEIGAIAAIADIARPGEGRAKRFEVTPEGFAALILNLSVLRSDPTVDGSEFELKRALVAMCTLVWEHSADLPEDLPLAPEVEDFFARVERLEVLGRRVITEETLEHALDILGLIATQKVQIVDRLAAAEARLAGLEAQASLLRGIDLGALTGESKPEPASESAPAALAGLLATGELPRLSVGATALRYKSYLDYLERLTALYSNELRRIDLATFRRLVGGRTAGRAAS